MTWQGRGPARSPCMLRLRKCSSCTPKAVTHYGSPTGVTNSKLILYHCCCKNQMINTKCKVTRKMSDCYRGGANLEWAKEIRSMPCSVDQRVLQPQRPRVAECLVYYDDKTHACSDGIAVFDQFARSIFNRRGICHLKRNQPINRSNQSNRSINQINHPINSTVTGKGLILVHGSF